MDNNVLPQNTAMWGWQPEPDIASSTREPHVVQSTDGVSTAIEADLADELGEFLRLQSAVIDFVAKSKCLKLLLYGHSQHYRTTPELPSWVTDTYGFKAPSST